MSELHARVLDVIDDAVRPALRETGGEVELVEIDEDRVAKIRLSGTCRTCAATTMALVREMERTIRAAVPEIAFLELAL